MAAKEENTVGPYDEYSSLVAEAPGAKVQITSGSEPAHSKESLVAEVAELPLASPMPPAPTIDAPLQIHGDEIVMTCGDRRYRVRGLAKNLSFDALKVNVMASRAGEGGFHVDTIEMYAARQRQLFIKQAAEELNVKGEVVKRDFGRMLLKQEELQDEAVRKSLEPKEQIVTLSDEEQQALMSPNQSSNAYARWLYHHRKEMAGRCRLARSTDN